MKMRQLVPLLTMFLVWLPAYGSECPVTVPNMEDPFGTTNPSSSHGWYGSDELTALIPKDGHWVGMGPDRNYSDKFWWWRRGYNARKEPNPELIISGTRLDGPASPVLVTDTTNGYGENWSTMLVGMEFPTAGCWEVIGKYGGNELKLIVKVGGS